MHTKPHVERLARLLHNRAVRRVLHDHPDASLLMLVGDMSADTTDPGTQLVHLVPVAVCNRAGVLLAGAFDGREPGPGTSTGDSDARARWRALCEDLRPDFSLLARVSPVQLFVPYLLDLRQLDLRVETSLEIDPTFGTHRPDAD